MPHAGERSWSIYNHSSETSPDERLVHIGYLKTLSFEYEFKDIFPMVYDTPARHLRNEIWKFSNLIQNGVFNMFSWYKLK